MVDSGSFFFGWNPRFAQAIQVAELQEKKDFTRNSMVMKVPLYLQVLKCPLFGG